MFRTVATAADAEMNDDTVLREQLLDAEMRREMGEISDEEFADIEADLLARIREEKLPEEAYSWYLDIRRYGTFPHSGFGLGIERTVAWITGRHHIREFIPFPRLMNRLFP